MKQITLLLLASLMVLSCKKEDEEPPTTKTPTSSASGYDTFFIRMLNTGNIPVDSIYIENNTAGTVDKFYSITSSIITCDTGDDDLITLSLSNEPNIDDNCTVTIYQTTNSGIQSMLQVVMFFETASFNPCDKFSGNIYNPDSSTSNPTSSIYEVIVK